MLTKILSVFVLNLLIAVPVKAGLKEQQNIKFPIETESLVRGDVHYALDVVSPAKFTEKYPELLDLDSLALHHKEDGKLVIAKSAFIVNKPAGFFDHEHAGKQEYLKHIMGEQRLNKLGDNHYKVTVPGESSHSYQIKSYFDSDEISTLPNSKIIRAVTQAKKLDVISQSASSTVFKELTKYSRFADGGVQVSSYIPLKENLTLVLTYTLSSVKKPFAKKKLLKANLSQEAQAQKELINSFKSEQK